MTLERRLGAGMLEQPTDDPGLVLDEDGTVWLVDADGTRTQVSGGGSSLPQDLASVLAEGNDASGGTISNLADPSADQEVATKNYVDGAIAANVTPFASYSGEPETLASFDDADLPFTFLGTTTDLLDRTMIGQPTFLSAGVYVITVLVSASGGGTGNQDIRLLAGLLGIATYASADELGVGVTLSGCFSVAADDVVRVFCSNHGADSIDLALASAMFARVGS